LTSDSFFFIIADIYSTEKWVPSFFYHTQTIDFYNLDSGFRKDTRQLCLWGNGIQNNIVLVSNIFNFFSLPLLA